MKKYIHILIVAAFMLATPFLMGALTVDQILNNIYDSTETALKMYMIYDEVIGDFTADETTFHVDSTNNRVGVGTITPDDIFQVESTTALTNTVDYVGKFLHTTTGTEAAGIGTGIQFATETGAVEEIGMTLDAVTTDVTGASEDFDFSLKLMAAGAAAAEKFKVASTGIVTLVNSGVIDNSTNGTVKIDEPSAATNTVIDILTVGHSTSGTAAAGIGTGIAFQTEDDGGAVQTGLTLDAVTTTATAASEDYDFVVGLMDGGVAAAEKFRVVSDGTVSQTMTGTVKTFVYEADALADDGEVALPDASNGILHVSCNAEMLAAVVANDGSVVLTAGVTANTAATESDGNLCVFDDGTNVSVKNALGATGNCLIIYHYDD